MYILNSKSNSRLQGKPQTFVKCHYDNNGYWGQYEDIESQYADYFNERINYKQILPLPLQSISERKREREKEREREHIQANFRDDAKIKWHKPEQTNYQNLGQPKSEKEDIKYLDKRIHFASIFCIITITTLIFS